MSIYVQERTARPAGSPSANFAARWNWYVQDLASRLRRDFIQFLRSLAKFLRLRADPPVAVRQHDTIHQLLEDSQKLISRLDAEILLAHVLGVGRAELYIYDGVISQGLIEKFHSLVDRRAAGEPLQYILGTAQFMGLEFIVTPDVLIPRPETELLVEEVIKAVKGVENPFMLDLGTGSGNIAISLTKFISDCKIIASDISEKALLVAKKNAVLNCVGDRIEFRTADLFDGLIGYKFDIIASNPPYVARPEFAGFQREIGFEPRLALDGGADGFDFYRRIIKEAGAFLSAGGRLFLEIGFGQADHIRSLFEKHCYKNILFIEDYSAIKRIAIGQWTN